QTPLTALPLASESRSAPPKVPNYLAKLRAGQRQAVRVDQPAATQQYPAVANREGRPAGRSPAPAHRQSGLVPSVGAFLYRRRRVALATTGALSRLSAMPATWVHRHAYESNSCACTALRRSACCESCTSGGIREG